MANMIPISTVVVGSGGASTMEFNNIPQSYTDLVIKYSTRLDAASVSNRGGLRFNGSTTGYSNRYITGDGTNASSQNNTLGYINLDTGANATTSTFANSEIYIPNYTSSNNKSYSSDSVSENNATLAYISLYASLWSNTAPINSITLTPGLGNFVQYTSATLYGIRKY